MKKILLLLFIPLLGLAQENPDWEYDINRPIGAFFPSYLPITIDRYVATQNTYYEYNWVSNNLGRLIERNLGLNYASSDDKNTYINDTYKTPAGPIIDNLKIRYNIFTIYGMYVVSSIEVTGSRVQVAKLFIYLYDNKIQSGNLTNGLIKTLAQDRAVYSNINGVASIKISNAVYKGKSQFKADFDKLKEDFKTKSVFEELEKERKRIEDEQLDAQRKQDEEIKMIAKKEKLAQDSIRAKQIRDSIPKQSIMVYYFSKSGSKLKFKNQPPVEVEKLISEKMSGYKKGDYSAYVVTTTIIKSKDYDIKINRGRK